MPSMLERLPSLGHLGILNHRVPIRPPVIGWGALTIGVETAASISAQKIVFLESEGLYFEQ